MPSTVAMRKCAELMFVPPRFDVYRAVSQQVHAIFRAYTPLVEPLSLDEAYLDVTENLKGVPTAWVVAKDIRARIYKETELTASAGVSSNKFLAKLASDLRRHGRPLAFAPELGARRSTSKLGAALKPASSVSPFKPLGRLTPRIKDAHQSPFV
jgi:DNA polymerase-4